MIRRVGANPLLKPISKMSLKRLFWSCDPIIYESLIIYFEGALGEIFFFQKIDFAAENHPKHKSFNLMIFFQEYLRPYKAVNR